LDGWLEVRAEGLETEAGGMGLTGEIAGIGREVVGTGVWWKVNSPRHSETKQ